MEVITTHWNTDFDGLASMIAAQKLYPEAVMVMPGKLSKDVEEFMSLHKDIFDIFHYKDIDLKSITKIILVDTKNPRRTHALQEIFNIPNIDIHIYDHHPWSEGDIRGSIEMVETVGSTTTLMVEKLLDLKIDITPLEATIFALGIYCDTGSLLFTNTTARDVRAAAYLIERDANLAVVSEFINRPLSPEQDELLKKLLLSGQTQTLHGFKILISQVETKEYIDGLSFLTHIISTIEKLDAIFTVVKMEDRVYIVARSTTSEIDVANILISFNGAGHSTAAAATVKNGNILKILERLQINIKNEIKPSLMALDIMSSPVKTVFQNTTIHEANRVMMRYGHTGLPVVEGLVLKGIVSQRDVDKAYSHGLGHAPVKGFMQTNVMTVSPSTPVTSIRKMLVSKDIGRVPVVEDGQLLGIISRTDILITLHGENQRKKTRKLWCTSETTADKNIYSLMKKSLLPTVLTVLYQAGWIAKELNYKAYAAGGIVRDLLLGYDNIDVDIVIEGDGIAVAADLAEHLGCQMKIHQRFGTAELIFPDGFKVDVATARVEYYEYPASLPQVERATLRQDLYRRDFSINAMAISVNEDNFGEIIDYFGGREDLQSGHIRILYTLSFIEDPTRMLRAVRFEQRYKMKIEPQTLSLLQKAVKKKVLHKVSSSRLWDEIRNILLEPSAEKMLYRLEHLNLWEQVFPDINFWKIQNVIQKLDESNVVLKNLGTANYKSPWMPIMIAITHLCSQKVVVDLCSKFSFNKKQTEIMLTSLEEWQNTLNLLKHTKYSGGPLSNLAENLSKIPTEAFPLLYSLLEEEDERNLFKEVLLVLNNKMPLVKGDYIKSLGYKPGPMYRTVLKELWRAKIDGLVNSEEDERAFVSSKLKKMMGDNRIV